MKLDGKKLSMAREEVVLPRPGGENIRLVVQAFPLGAEEEAVRLFPDPVAPIRFATGRKGKPLRDPHTNEVVKIRDLQDAEYRQAVRVANRRQMMFLIVEGLKAEPRLEFETDPKLRETDPGAYFDALFEEFNGCGFATGDLGLILGKIRELGNLTGPKIDEAVEAFLSEGQAV